MVKVYIYVPAHQEKEETVDEYIVKLAFQKEKIVNQFETYSLSKKMKEIAVDCELFKERNYQADGEYIK